MTNYPVWTPGGSLLVAWQLRDRHVLLVGGGDVAAGRLVHLKNADAKVTVLCPRAGLCDEMAYRVDEEHAVEAYRDEVYSHEDQLLRPDTNTPYDMVLTAIDDEGSSRAVCLWCRARRVPVNVADVPSECDFYFGSVLRRGALQVMVSTGGKGPRLARQIRQRLEEALPPSIGTAIERVGTLRAELRKRAPASRDSARRMAWMTDVCETWTMDELAQLDDAAIEQVLQGWKDHTVPKPGTVFGHAHAHALWAWPQRRDWVSFMLGATSVTLMTLGYAKYRMK